MHSLSVNSTVTTMFAKTYQTGETGVEVFTPSGSSDPLKIFQVTQESTAPVQKEYDRSIKGYSINLNNESTVTKIQCPTKPFSTLHLIQPLFCLQLFLSADHSFSLEINIFDRNRQRKRFHFSTHFKERECAATSLSAKLPWPRVVEGSWRNYIIDLQELCQSCFLTSHFASIDSFVLHPVCRLRKIFTLPITALHELADSRVVVTVPANFDFPVGSERSDPFLYHYHLNQLEGTAGRKAEAVSGGKGVKGVSIQGKAIHSSSTSNHNIINTNAPTRATNTNTTTASTATPPTTTPTLSERIKLKLKNRRSSTVSSSPSKATPRQLDLVEINNTTTMTTPRPAAVVTPSRDDVVSKEEVKEVPVSIQSVNATAASDHPHLSVMAPPPRPADPSTSNLLRLSSTEKQQLSRQIDMRISQLSLSRSRDLDHPQSREEELNPLESLDSSLHKRRGSGQGLVREMIDFYSSRSPSKEERGDLSKLSRSGSRSVSRSQSISEDYRPDLSFSKQMKEIRTMALSTSSSHSVQEDRKVIAGIPETVKRQIDEVLQRKGKTSASHSLVGEDTKRLDFPAVTSPITKEMFPGSPHSDEDLLQLLNHSNIYNNSEDRGRLDPNSLDEERDAGRENSRQEIACPHDNMDNRSLDRERPLEGEEESHWQELKQVYRDRISHESIVWSSTEKAKKLERFAFFVDTLRGLENSFLQLYGEQEFQDIVGPFSWE